MFIINSVVLIIPIRYTISIKVVSFLVSMAHMFRCKFNIHNHFNWGNHTKNTDLVF